MTEININKINKYYGKNHIIKDVSLDTLFLNMADYLAAKGPNVTLNGWNDHFKIIETI